MTPGAPPNSQLPNGEEIFLDHVGHFVRDAQSARDALARAGFAPTPISIQTLPDRQGGAPRLTGTGNTTAMLTHGYIEMLFKTADTPLGQEFEAALARYPGVHLAAFAVADAATAHARLAQDGFRMRPLVHMQRPVEIDVRPSTSKLRDGLATDGSPPPCGEGMGVGVASFTVARLEPGEMPEGRIQLLTHHTEALVWQPRWLSHPNGALGLESVLIVVADPQEAAQRFARLTGRPARALGSSHSIALDRGAVELVTPSAFSQAYPGVPIPSVPFIGVYQLKTNSVDKTERCLVQGGLRPQRIGGELLCAFPPELGHGGWRFSAADDASPR